MCPLHQSVWQQSKTIQRRPKAQVGHWTSLGRSTCSTSASEVLHRWTACLKQGSGRLALMGPVGFLWSTERTCANTEMVSCDGEL